MRCPNMGVHTVETTQGHGWLLTAVNDQRPMSPEWWEKGDQGRYHRRTALCAPNVPVGVMRVYGLGMVE